MVDPTSYRALDNARGTAVKPESAHGWSIQRASELSKATGPLADALGDEYFLSIEFRIRVFSGRSVLIILRLTHPVIGAEKEAKKKENVANYGTPGVSSCVVDPTS